MGEGFSSDFYKQKKKKNDKNEITDIYIYMLMYSMTIDEIN